MVQEGISSVKFTLSLATLLSLLVVAIWLFKPYLMLVKTEDHDKTMLSTLSDAYQQLSMEADSIGGNWLRTMNPNMQNVQGDLVWNTRLQSGVMRFIQLPPPARNTAYHLWIHDSRQMLEQPILAATLTTGSGKDELLVKLTPQKLVIDPYKFLLTQQATANDSANMQILLMVQP